MEEEQECETNLADNLEHYKENIPISGNVRNNEQQQKGGQQSEPTTATSSSSSTTSEIDPKRAFLDQLAATLKQNSTNSTKGATSGKAKLGKNKSDVNKTSETTTNTTAANGGADPQFSDDTQLMAKFAFGAGDGLDLLEKADKRNNQANNNNFIDDDDEHDENMMRHTGFKRRGNIGSFGSREKSGKCLTYNCVKL